MLPEGIGVTRSQDALIRLIQEDAPIVLCLGYAGWSAGQLDREIEEGGWLAIEAEAQLVFDAAPEEIYDLALSRLGLTAATVWMQPISE
jgi:putative transcriptional regulator